MLEFTRRLIALRRSHPVFRRREFLAGREVEGSGLPDVWWFRPDGRRMTQRDWQRPTRTCSACSSTARRSPTARREGEPIEDDSFLLLFNAHHEDVTFTLPARRFGAAGCSSSTPSSRRSSPARSAGTRAARCSCVRGR